MTDTRVISIDRIKVACSDCSLATLCLPYGLEPNDVDLLESIVKRGSPLHRGEYLFREGDSFKQLYAVKSGALKTYCHNRRGDEQVLGFHLPGELIGLDAIQDGVHGCSAKALETTAVCQLPFDQLEQLATTVPSLQRQMMRLMSHEISQENEMMSLLGSSSAEERLASFLLGLSGRYQRRGFSPVDFFLTMSRQEIGSYLGLALETVSRLFTRFQDEGILKVERKHVQIVDLEGLQAITTSQTRCLHQHHHRA